MPRFRITYHTSGGAFSREFDADSLEAAEAETRADLESGPLFRFVDGDVTIVLHTALVAAFSIEPAENLAGERRAGLLGSIKGEA